MYSSRFFLNADEARRMQLQSTRPFCKMLVSMIKKIEKHIKIASEQNSADTLINLEERVSDPSVVESLAYHFKKQKFYVQVVNDFNLYISWRHSYLDTIYRSCNKQTTRRK